MLSCVPCVSVRGSHVAVVMQRGNKGGYTGAARRHRLALPVWYRDKAVTTAVVSCDLCPVSGSPVCTFGTCLFNPFTAMMSAEKRPIKVQNLKPLTVSLLIFALSWERIFIEAHSIESRCVIGPENILFAGASVHLSAQNFHKNTQ